MQGTALLVHSPFELTQDFLPALPVGGENASNAGEIELFSVTLAPGASLELNLPWLVFDATTEGGSSLDVAVTVRACVSGTTVQTHCSNPSPDAKGSLQLDVNAFLEGYPRGTRLTVYAAPTCSAMPITASGTYAGLLSLQLLNPAT